jgi:hypothetical protein
MHGETVKNALVSYNKNAKSFMFDTVRHYINFTLMRTILYRKYHLSLSSTTGMNLDVICMVMNKVIYVVTCGLSEV